MLTELPATGPGSELLLILGIALAGGGVSLLLIRWALR